MKKTMTFFEKTRRFFSPVKYNKLVYFWWGIINFIWSIDRVIHVLFLERIIHFLEKKDMDMFYLTLQIYIGYIIYYTVSTFLLRKKGWPETISSLTKYLQDVYLSKFVQLHNNYVERYGTGKLTAIIDKGITRWGELMDFFINQSIGLIISFVFTGYMLYQSNALFLFIFIVIYFTFYIASYFLNLGALKYRRKRRDCTNNITQNLVKVLMNKQEILQSGKITHEVSILKQYNDDRIGYNKRVAEYLYGMFEGPNIVGTIAIILMFYFFGQQYIEGKITLSLIVGSVSALILMKDAIDRGIKFFKDFTKTFVDIEKLWEFFDDAPLIEGYNVGETFLYKQGNIDLKNICYAYVEGKNVIDNLSLGIQGGSITAFVGPSGGGKSTIVKLIGGYLEAGSGDIIIDGQNISTVSLQSYYKNIGYLTQEPSVFDGTVLENLTYATDESISKESIQEAITMSKCEFIYDLPNGLDTQIGERGVKLSGGQRQRLAIAKIILKNPKIIILDEPTSALDSFSEEQITIALNNLFKNRTVIVIAHRLQTVKHADKIFLIESGKVKEEGNHESLKQANGLYKKMLDLQSGF